MLKFFRKIKRRYQLIRNSGPKLSSIGNTLSLIIVFLSLGIVVTVSYFGPGPLNNVFSFLSSLPNVFQKPATDQSVITAEPLIPLKNYNQKLQSGPYNCPTIFSLCQTSGVYQKNSLSGTVSKDTPVFAAFDGLAEGLKSTYYKDNGTTEEFYLTLLINKEKGLQAKYYFKGRAPEKREVKAGEIIGTVNGEPLSYKQNQPFTFELSKITAEGEVFSPLSSASFR